MNLGDGLLFELENGKPKLILLSHGVEKNPTKQQLSLRPRASNILSSRQPSCVEEVQGGARQHAGRTREPRSKAGGAATSFTSNNNTTTTTATTGGRSSTLTSSKTNEHHRAVSIKTVAKVKSDRHKHTTTVGSLRANGRTAGPPQNNGTHSGGTVGLKTAVKDSVVSLTSDQLQQILLSVQTCSKDQQPPEDHSTQESKPDSSLNGEGGEGELKEEDRGGGGGAGRPQDKDNRLSGCPFSWLEEQQSHSRAAIDAKKAQWRRELDEQVALKQQQHRLSPGRLQAEEDRGSVLSVQSSFSLRETLRQPAAIRSSLTLGEVIPMEEVLCDERKEEQRRRWLEELNRQREETTERRRREKELQRQTEDHQLWTAHFDSLQRKPPVQTATPSAPSAPPPASCSSERGEWEPSSSLSLVWEATSSCGAESLAGASIDSNGYSTRASYLRTMTALLDPAQIEERERRRLKQQEQQRAIEAQVEERRRQREQEEARRREEEEEEERRVRREREMLDRRYELDSLREKQKSSHQAEEPQRSNNDDDDDGKQQEKQEPIAVNTSQSESLEEEVTSSSSPYRHTAVQTEAPPSLPSDRVQTPDVSAQYQPPPPPSTNSRSHRGLRTGKENICLPGGGGGGGGGGGAGGGGGGDPYEAFARTDRSRRDKRRPEWNTQRPSRRFVPASERYPAALQRNRQENRQRRQAELLALQERTCLSRTEPPPAPPAPPQRQEPPLCSDPPQTGPSPSRRVEVVSGAAASNTDRRRSPPVPTLRHRAQSQQASSSTPPPPAPPPPVLDFIPYVRTDDVFNLDPLEPANTPPPHTHTAPPQSSASPPAPSHRLLHPELLRNSQTSRQQEILRGLAQLRQGLLQKQRELETDLNPLLKRHDNEHRAPSAAHRM
ncbi:coiled-coil domain-containing protein 66 [Centropristis striata]|uniref:coiled-coil domain-containing protein 66 n=1 Tax=Centropristis striata TaxID=184440 RepID=UPI0027DF2787|nr:coiled-coil domain-containing protein 66 [Centropristis striata]